MGTPDFAVPSLNALCDSGFNVAAVVTQPDKPSGRGYSLKPSPVKVAALLRSLPVLQPETLKKVDFEQTLTALAPSLVVVAAFGKLLPPYLLRFPEFGCINVHGSLLPKYRGAAPMQRAIIDGETVTGVTIMRMEKGLDTGDMYCSVSVPIGENDNFEVIHDRLAAEGAKALVSTLLALGEDCCLPVKQDDSMATYAAKIENSDCALDFSRCAKALHDQIRGLSPFPLACCSLNGRRLKIIDSTVDNGEAVDALPGTVLSTDGGNIRIACGKGALIVSAIQPDGKRRMSSADFINGRGVKPGDRLGGPQ